MRRRYKNSAVFFGSLVVCLAAFSLSSADVILDAQTKANLRSILKRGEAKGRIPGKLGQWGDSITYSMAFLGSLGSWGCDASPTCASYQPTLLWMKACETSSGSGVVGGGCTATPLIQKGAAHACYSGWKTTDGLNQLTQTMAVDNPSWAFSMFGTNDLPDDSTRESYRHYYEYLLKAAMYEGIVPALSTIPPRRGAAASVAVANTVLQELAGSLHLPLVDFYSGCLEYHPADWDGTTISNDGVHPSLLGSAGNFETPLSHDSGYTIRNMECVDYARKLRQIVFENGPPDGPDLPVLEVSSGTHPWGEYVNQTQVSVSWRRDGGDTPTAYSYVLDQTEDTVPDQTDEGTGMSAMLAMPGSGDWYFHVRAASQAGWGPASHYWLRILADNQLVLQEGANGYHGTSDAVIKDGNNYGDQALAEKENGAGGAAERFLIRFSLDSLPAVAVVSAKLELFVGESSPDVLQIHALSKSWEEGDSRGQGKTGVTYYCRAANDQQPWESPGGDYQAAFATCPVAGGFSWVSLDVTEWVRSGLTSPVANCGWIILGSQPLARTVFFSKEFPWQALRPRLVLTTAPLSSVRPLPPRSVRLGY